MSQVKTNNSKFYNLKGYKFRFGEFLVEVSYNVS